MRLTTKSQCGFQVLELLVRNWHEAGNGYLQIGALALHCGISPKYLERVLLPLAHAGILDSKRGQRGGYRLNHPPESISLAEVVRHLEGRLMPIPSWAEDNVDESPGLVGVLQRVREVLRATLETTTIAILANDSPPPREEDALVFSQAQAAPE